MIEPSDEGHSVDEIAQAWLAKMRGPDAAAVRGEFYAWVGSARAHRDAYDRARQHMAASAILKTSARYGSAKAATRRSRLAGWMPAGVGAAAAALFIVAVGTGTVTLPGLPSGSASTAQAAVPLATEHGEIRTFALEDGSSLTLDTDSRALVTMDPDRKVELVKGRARLRVARRDIPMRVAAGSVGLTTDSAEIDIGIDPDGAVRLVLAKGNARLASGRAPASAAQLTPGCAIAFERGGKPTDSGAEIPRSWPAGWVDYRSISLAELVAETNRYASRPLILEDPGIGGLEISGRFQVNRAEHLARRIGLLFDLVVEERADGLYLRRR